MRNIAKTALIEKTVQEILRGFSAYIAAFNAISRLAPVNFRERDWNGLQKNHKKRLRLYKDHLVPIVTSCKAILSENTDDRSVWKEVKAEFTHLVANRTDSELAESFFNSVFRKTYPGKCVDETLMFVFPGSEKAVATSDVNLFHTYRGYRDLKQVFGKMLDDFHFGEAYYQKESDVAFLAESFDRGNSSGNYSHESPELQVLKTVFFRNKAAYLIGRSKADDEWKPFLIPFVHNEKGVFADTLILDPDIMSGIFSYTRSYFMADIEVPFQVVSFLNTLIKNKRPHELYNAIGFNKHGKTEFYRDFLKHLSNSNDQFVLAPGIKGMVMTVFTLPSYNIVFKLIKDHFDPPKNMTRQQVREKYKLVSLHDRVGRMADTHEFENFKLPLTRIHPELLSSLKNSVSSLLDIQGDTLIIKHLYTERRLEPLNLYLSDCQLEEAKEVVVEYGNAILQLAQANIFPGDMMTKNFGVTRQKRVIFYDYDEIEFLVDMNFREKPMPETYEQIYASKPWYDVASSDVFPEDFKRFMIGRRDIKEYFFEVHKNLFDPNCWNAIRSSLRDGALIHVFPYPSHLRFRPNEEI